MSSVVKKGSRFMPKLKKQPLKKKSVTPLTPPTTQKEESSQPSQPIEESKPETQEEQDEAEDKFQDAVSSPRVDFRFAKSSTAKATTEDIDPMDTSSKISPGPGGLLPGSALQIPGKDSSNDAAVSSGDDDDDEDRDYGDNDIFKKPEDNITSTAKFRRQSSIQMQRRLSGITPSIIRHRSGSISHTPTPFGSVPPESPRGSISGSAGGSVNGSISGQSQAPPAIKIGIPISKPSKRRKSSSIARLKRNSFLSNATASVIGVPKEPTPEEPAEVEEPPRERKRKFSVGVDPSTQKLTKYRISSNIAAILNHDDVSDDEEDTNKSKDDGGVGGTNKGTAVIAENVNENDEGNVEEVEEEQNDEGETEGVNTGRKKTRSVTKNITVKQEKISKKIDSIPKKPKAKRPVAKKLEQLKIVQGKLTATIESMTQVPRSFKDEDPKDLEEVTISEEKMKMSDLCQPSFYIGKPGTRYQKVLEAEEHIQKKKIERRKARELARESKKSLEEVTGEALEEQEREKKKDLFGEGGALAGLDQTPSNNGIQLKLVGGQLEVDPESTSVDRHLHNANLGKDREEANPFNNPITSSSYSKRKYTDRWSDDEVKEFYKALSTWGTDFTFIAQLFPHRTRKQIKSKFNLEERKHPEIVELALRRKLPADFDKYCEEANKSFLSLDEYNAQLTEIQVIHKKDMEQFENDRKKAKEEEKVRERQLEIERKTGTKSMTRAEKVRELRRNETVLGSIEDVKKQRDDEIPKA
ncbi:transcription factor TFIIIB component B'' [[Candida] anglica]